jgi:UDP-N-acetylmuramoyl-tripeptide--D-alanyl-D-alanine ligase
VELKVPVSDIISSLNQYKGLSGRMNIITGIKNTLIIDDSYNSSPVAMEQALDVFSNIQSSGRKILAVGDMLELGKYSAEEHRKSAHKIKEVADYVLCVGIRSRLIVDELLSLEFPESNIIQTDSSYEAGIELQKILEEGDIVLVKGSQTMRMERVVEEVMRHPQDKDTLLVRQEPEWLERE